MVPRANIGFRCEAMWGLILHYGAAGLSTWGVKVGYKGLPCLLLSNSLAPVTRRTITLATETRAPSTQLWHAGLWVWPYLPTTWRLKVSSCMEFD